MDSKA
jgi:SpoVK/Ycf46/Vps4 family AAA+-type ATPase